MKPFFYKVSLLMMVPFLQLVIPVAAQEKPANPFQGYDLLVISDGSSGAMRILPVLGSIREHKVLATILPLKISESVFKEYTTILKSVGMDDAQVERQWDNSLVPSGKKVLCLCLGDPALIKSAGIPLERIERVIAVGEFNGTESCQVIIEAGISLDLLTPGGKMPYSPGDINLFSNTGTATGKLYASLVSSMKKPQMDYELAGIYLLFPEVINMKPELANPRLSYSTGFDPEMMKSILTDILAGAYRAGDGVAFTGFPMDPAFYKYDVRQIMDSTISRYGAGEWKACVLTDEIHGHLGIYSVIGAKMGMLARDYFSSGPDKLKVTSYAGSKPPKSCFNDGLQASTGATVGQGLITIAGGAQQLTAADFEYQGRKIRIELKEFYLQQIEADISRGIAEYGLMNAGYWKMVRNLSLGYWRDWDRKKIFTIKQIP